MYVKSDFKFENGDRTCYIQYRIKIIMGLFVNYREKKKCYNNERNGIYKIVI